jgi:hypothetical protein
VEGMTDKVTDGGKKKLKLDPESDIMTVHGVGDQLSYTDSGLTDSLSLDAFADLKSKETTDERLHRNLSTADFDGPQMEGMESPIDAFERNAMLRQLHKNQDVYGFQDYEPSEADKLSELNR